MPIASHLLPKGGYWLRADPVQFQADVSAVLLLGNDHLQLSTSEVEALLKELNQLLARDHLSLHAPDNNGQHWYLHAEKPFEIKTYPLKSVVGKPIDAYLPEGKDRTQWRALMTEIQMLLHHSQVNQKRVAEGKAPVNGIWLWEEIAFLQKILRRWKR